MSTVRLEQVKAFLDVTFDDDDEKIQMLIDSAEDETKKYLDRGDTLPRSGDPCPECVSESTLNPASDSSDIAPSVRNGIFLLVQAMYDQPGPSEMEATRQLAFGLMRPYRCKLGV
jgi:hypothetical protein